MTPPEGPTTGWYPDPHGPPGQERWWDATQQQWGEYTRAAPAPISTPPRSYRRRNAIAIAIGALVVLWATGSLDEPLSGVGLNKETCAKNLFGNKMCGDELVAFCKSNYDKDVNADTCDDVLRDAGLDPAAIVSAQKQKDAAESAHEEQDFQNESARIDDSSAKSDARNIVSAVETCFVDTSDYARCQRESQLGYPSALIGRRQGEVEIEALSSGSYRVIAHSTSGTDFTVEKGETGATTRTCSSAGAGGCPASGRW